MLNGNQEAYDTGLLLTQMGTGVVMDMALSSPCVCFVAGTQVSTQRGFEVEDFRTYYVGESSVLVHNECGPKKQETYETRKQAFNAAKRDLGVPRSQ